VVFCQAIPRYLKVTISSTRFTGHVHHYFHNRWREVEIYCIPAVAFIRPEYTDMFPVGPAEKNGRNDSA